MSLLADTVPLGETCPNCGGWATALHNVTGWCIDCTLIAYPDHKVCTTCGDLYPKKAQVSKCWPCRKEEWLSRHADAIEGYLATGLTLTAALAKVADDIRPNCQKCGEPIRGGKSGTRFCNKKPGCKAAARHYRELQKTGLSPDAALAIATQRVAVFDSKLT